jgi:hypothetical protein
MRVPIRPFFSRNPGYNSEWGFSFPLKNNNHNNNSNNKISKIKNELILSSGRTNERGVQKGRGC